MHLLMDTFAHIMQIHEAQHGIVSKTYFEGWQEMFARTTHIHAIAYLLNGFLYSFCVRNMCAYVWGHL